MSLSLPRRKLSLVMVCALVCGVVPLRPLHAQVTQPESPTAPSTGQGSSDVFEYAGAQFQRHWEEYSRASTQTDEDQALIGMQSSWNTISNAGVKTELAALLAQALASARLHRGELPETLQLFDEAREILEHANKDNDLQYVDLCERISEIALMLGDKKHALDSLRAADQAATNALNTSLIKAVMIKISLSMELRSQDKIAEASQVLLAASKLLETSADPPPLVVASLDVALADLGLGLFDKARRLNRQNDARESRGRSLEHANRAVLILKELDKTGESSPDLLNICYDILGKVHHRSHDAEDVEMASKYYKASLAQLKLVATENPVPILLAETWVADIEAKANRWEVAARHFDTIRRGMHDYISDTFPTLSRNQQVAFLTSYDLQSLHLSACLAQTRASDLEIAELSAAWVLNGKAVMSRTLSRRAGPERSTIATLPWVTVEAVRSHLPPDCVLIEFMKVLQYDFQGDGSPAFAGEPRYVAWVIPAANTGKVRVLDLGPVSEVDRHVTSVLEAMAHAKRMLDLKFPMDIIQRESVPGLKELSEMILDPLLPAAGQARRWIVSPDSKLWNLPFHALQKDGKFFIETHDVAYVKTGRDVPHLATAGARNTGSLLLINPDYGALIPPGRDDDPIVRPDSEGQRPGKTFPRHFSAIGLDDAAEADIVALMSKIGHEQTGVLRGTHATKSSIFDAKAPRVATFITHAVYLPDQDFDDMMQGMGGWPDLRALSVAALPNPLDWCAIALAGANQREKGDRTGVLTGEQIAQLNWADTDLVMLVTCVSAQGINRSGQSLESLTHAFHLAGVRTVIGTLWDIPTDQSVSLAKTFWKELADRGDKTAALCNAQREFISQLRKKDAPAHPFFWAGMTLSGPDCREMFPKDRH